MNETGRIVRGRVIGEVREGQEVDVELLELDQFDPDESSFRVWPPAALLATGRCIELAENSETRCDGKSRHRARFHWHVDLDTGQATMWLDKATIEAERELREAAVGTGRFR